MLNSSCRRWWDMLNAYLAYPAFKDCFEPYFNLVDFDAAELVIFSGGEDINPNIYGERNHGSYGVNQRRDEIEIEVYERAKAAGKRMLGVCRGHQLLMALNGGKLVQNIFPGHPGWHTVDVLHDAPLLASVNSLHHQGITPENVPLGFTVTSVYDGIVESTVSDSILTVQWHPEFLDYAEGSEFFNMVQKWVRDE